MGRHSVLRWVVFLVLTMGLVASLATMFAMRGGLDEVWLYASFSLYGMALLVYWLIVAGSRPTLTQGRDDVAEKVALALASQGAPSATTIPDAEPEIVVEPSRTEPIVLPTPARASPAPYQFRGFTLYQRGESRFFSKAAPPGAQSIQLPEGFEAKWDGQKAKPVLVEITAPEAEEPEVAIEIQRKPCSAMIAPGEFCENFAKEGSRFCARHVDFTTEEELFEVRKSPTTSKGKAPKFSAPQIEVRYARPSAKPFRLKPGKQPQIEVRLAKPSNTKELEYKRGKAIEVKAPKSSSKPFKPKAGGNVVVQLGKPGTQKPFAMGTAPAPEVRLAKPSLAKPIKFRKSAEPNVRVAKPDAPKPLRLKAAHEPAIRVDQATPGKASGKRLAASELVVRAPPPSKPVPKGKQLAASEVVVKKPGAAKPVPALKVSREEFEVRSARDAKTSSKPFKAKEPEIVVVKDTKRRSMLGVEGEARKKS